MCLPAGRVCSCYNIISYNALPMEGGLMGAEDINSGMHGNTFNSLLQHLILYTQTFEGIGRTKQFLPYTQYRSI